MQTISWGGRAAALAMCGLAILGSAACSNSSPTPKTSSAVISSAAIGAEPSPIDGSDDPAENDIGVRIPLGSSKTAVVPADAVLDIKGEPDWDKAALRCKVTDVRGQYVKLLPPPDNIPAESAAHGGTWIALWTIAASPGAVLTVTCLDPDRKIPYTETSFVRVVPRGLLLGH